MMEDVILNSYSLCSLNHCQITVIFSSIINKIPLKFPIPLVWSSFQNTGKIPAIAEPSQEGTRAFRTLVNVNLTVS